MSEPAQDAEKMHLAAQDENNVNSVEKSESEQKNSESDQQTPAPAEGTEPTAAEPAKEPEQPKEEQTNSENTQQENGEASEREKDGDSVSQSQNEQETASQNGQETKPDADGDVSMSDQPLTTEPSEQRTGEAKIEMNETPKPESSEQPSSSQENKRPNSEVSEEDSEAKRPKVEEKDPAQMTPLEKAQKAAENARIGMLPELDPAQLPAPGSGLPKHQHRYSLSAIRAIKRLKDALPFVVPVDPVKQGVPQYFEYIKKPMDLGTMEAKLNRNEYDTVSALVDDFNLIVSNCIIFNGEEALISKMGLSIAQSFKKQLSNMPTYDASKKGGQAAAAAALSSGSNDHAIDDESAIHDDGTYGKRSSVTTTVMGPNGIATLRRKSTIDGRPKREIRPPRQHSHYVGAGTGEGKPRNKKYAAELRFCGQVLKEMQSRKLESLSWPFLQPVDPVEQGLPTYFDVVKEPMDLSTIQRKLSEGIYYTGDEFESDVRLMFRNCYSFNPESTPVNVLGHKLEYYFDTRWAYKPIPGAHHDDSDMSDVDEEYADTGMVNPAIDILEEQLRMIKKQLKKLKKDALADFHKRGSKRSNAAAKRRQMSGSHSNAGSAPPAPTEMTYEMKKELRDKIDNLPEKKIATVLDIIKESMPDLGKNGQEEIELEVDSLDTHTLLRLYNYAVLNRKEGPENNPASQTDESELTANGKKKKSKPLSEEEHNRKIAEIRSKIQEFDQASGKPIDSSLANSAQQMGVDAGSSAATAAVESDSSDDDDMDSDSSSEEE